MYADRATRNKIGKLCFPVNHFPHAACGTAVSRNSFWMSTNTDSAFPKDTCQASLDTSGQENR